ncbi:hypothetical protein B0H12DRAFT_1074115 [Mycena haematopus]|nr:hypothetical protein B0H12DRAFT_1074115 [Mycena haematopus]
MNVGSVVAVYGNKTSARHIGKMNYRSSLQWHAGTASQAIGHVAGRGPTHNSRIGGGVHCGRRRDNDETTSLLRAKVSVMFVQCKGKSSLQWHAGTASQAIGHVAGRGWHHEPTHNSRIGGGVHCGRRQENNKTTVNEEATDSMCPGLFGCFWARLLDEVVQETAASGYGQRKGWMYPHPQRICSPDLIFSRKQDNYSFLKLFTVLVQYSRGGLRRQVLALAVDCGVAKDTEAKGLASYRNSKGKCTLPGAPQGFSRRHRIDIPDDDEHEQLPLGERPNALPAGGISCEPARSRPRIAAPRVQGFTQRIQGLFHGQQQARRLVSQLQTTPHDQRSLLPLLCPYTRALLHTAIDWRRYICPASLHRSRMLSSAPSDFLDRALRSVWISVFSSLLSRLRDNPPRYRSTGPERSSNSSPLLDAYAYRPNILSLLRRSAPRWQLSSASTDPPPSLPPRPTTPPYSFSPSFRVSKSNITVSNSRVWASPAPHLRPLSYLYQRSHRRGNASERSHIQRVAGVDDGNGRSARTTVGM